MPPSAQPNWSQRERLRFIEAALLWEGEVKRQRVCDAFGVNANHVTKDIGLYKARFPGNIEYDQSAKAYRPAKAFKPHYASADPAEYLAVLEAYARSGAEVIRAALAIDRPLVDAVPEPPIRVSQALLSAFLQATQQGQGLQVHYASMSQTAISDRTLWPHSLIRVGHGWHVRAFDNYRSDFRTFAMQRMKSFAKGDGPSPRNATDDSAWHQRVTVEVIPNPALTRHQQSIIAQEYGMQKSSEQWIWRVELRQCLVGYFVSEHRLDTQPEDPLRVRLALRNRAEVEKHFFGPE